ncbi:HEPN domain-containing protein [Cytobacillus firmus]|nr:HEPN domain-containing protein [Cytobacillus firmus]
MKYTKFTFLAPIFFLKINTDLNKGILVKHNIRISNNNDYIKGFIDGTDIFEHIGWVGVKELAGSTYAYAQGNISDLYERYEGAKSELDICFIFLRELQAFLTCLWEVEDHSSYVRDGFMYLHNQNDPKDGGLYRASVSAIPSTAVGLHVESVFSREHILEAKSIFKKFTDYSLEHLTDGGKYPHANPLDKELSRVSRAMGFTSSARNESILPMKIFNYCTALECLFTTDNAEISHKNAERVAALLGSDIEIKMRIYSTVKKAYGVRSKLTHGQPVNNNIDDLRKLASELDNILREIFKKDLDFLSLKNPELENHYLQLVFKE